MTKTIRTPQKQLRFWRLIEGEIGVNEMAARLGVTRQSVWNYEQGLTLPIPEVAKKIEEITGIPATEWRKAS